MYTHICIYTYLGVRIHNNQPQLKRIIILCILLPRKKYLYLLSGMLLNFFCLYFSFHIHTLQVSFHSTCFELCWAAVYWFKFESYRLHAAEITHNKYSCTRCMLYPSSRIFRLLAALRVLAIFDGFFIKYFPPPEQSTIYISQPTREEKNIKRQKHFSSNLFNSNLQNKRRQINFGRLSNSTNSNPRCSF